MLIGLLLGSALIIAPIIIFVISFLKTPINLRGFYGKMFGAFLITSLVIGVVLITSSAIGLIA